MTITITSPAALTVVCPICDAQPGQPCRNAISGKPSRIVHLYRLQVVAEEATR